MYSIRFATPPETGAQIVIKRETPQNEPWVVWKDGSVIVASELNAANLQSLYVLQEAAFRVSKVESTCKSLKETLAAEVALVAISGGWSVDLTTTNNAISALKVDKADKTALTALQTVVDKKVDTTTVNAALALKADTSAVASSLALKASKAALEALAAVHDNVSVFATAGTYSVTAPPWANFAILSGCGGGGGGGAASNGSNVQGAAGGPGGHGGEIIHYPVIVKPNTVYTVTIAAGGAGATTAVTSVYGASGGTTSFGSLVSLGGGSGGGGNTFAMSGVSVGVSGTVGSSIVDVGSLGIFSIPAGLSQAGSTGLVGVGYGGGGSGGRSNSPTVRAGGAGAPGFLIVQWAA